MLIPLTLPWHESNGAVAGDGAQVHLTSSGTLVILITSFGEFLSYFIVNFFQYISLYIKKKKQCCRIISVLSWVSMFLLQGSYSSGLEIVNQD